MAKRRTKSESKIHEKAVKLRKMTDEQLVHYVEDRVAKAESEGYHRGKKEGFSAEKFIVEISGLSGIGAATLGKIKRLAIEMGYME